MAGCPRDPVWHEAGDSCSPALPLGCTLATGRVHRLTPLLRGSGF